MTARDQSWAGRMRRHSCRASAGNGKALADPARALRRSECAPLQPGSPGGGNLRHNKLNAWDRMRAMLAGAMDRSVFARDGCRAVDALRWGYTWFTALPGRSRTTSGPPSLKSEKTLGSGLRVFSPTGAGLEPIWGGWRIHRSPPGSVVERAMDAGDSLEHRRQEQRAPRQNSLSLACPRWTSGSGKKGCRHLRSLAALGGHRHG